MKKHGDKEKEKEGLTWEKLASQLNVDSLNKTKISG